MADSSSTALPIPSSPSAVASSPSAVPEGTTAVAGVPLADIDDGYDENDSAYGDEQSAYTASLTSSVKNHTFENGRRYASFQPTGSVAGYMMPNDNAEADRLDMHHHLAGLLIGGELITAPLAKPPQRILDIGAGTGLWTIEAGDAYPSAEIIGVDISPTQPSMVPPNVKFEVDDVEQEWTWKQPFDYIHSRFMAGSIRDWPKYIGQTFKHVTPGGWAEFKDWDITLRSSDNSIPPDSPVLKFHNMLYAGMLANGVTYMPGPSLKAWCEEAGYVNVTEKIEPVPLGMWPRDKRYKEIGAWNLLCLTEGLEGISLRLFIDVLGMTKEEVFLLTAGVRKAIKDRTLHAQYTNHTVTAQKPELET